MTSFTRPYIVAEAAQGFEGDATLAASSRQGVCGR